MKIDLLFDDLSVRAEQYNARASVENFDACMVQYETLATQAKTQTPGIYDIHYGMGVAERLDLFPHSQPAFTPVGVYSRRLLAFPTQRRCLLDGSQLHPSWCSRSHVGIYLAT